MTPYKDRKCELTRRLYWKQYRPADLLFPGKSQQKTYADTFIQKAMKVSAGRAGISKPVYPHVLRHSYATGLLEAGGDLLTISKLLGHASFVTTMIYLHCRREHLINAPSPLDWLPVRQLPTYRAPEENDSGENGSGENDPNLPKIPPTS